MAKLKFTVHPLFIIFGIYFAVIGKVYSFLIYTATALIHELGHAYVAGETGYRLNRIVLMPYGATVSGNLDNMSYRDEIKIALAGPLTNLVIVFIAVSFWWIIPESYAVTELIVVANLTLATVNLLPSYPLDGGRVLVAVLSSVTTRARALKIGKAIGLVLSGLLFILFIYSCFVGVNFSILLFSLFMLFGNVCVSNENSYVRLATALNFKNLSRAIEVKTFALSLSAPVRAILPCVQNSYAVKIMLFDKDGKTVLTLPPEKAVILLVEGDYRAEIYSEIFRLNLVDGKNPCNFSARDI